MLRQCIAVVTLAAFLFSPLRGVAAEDVQHLVPEAELQLQLFAAEQRRQNDLEDIERFLSRADTEEVVATAGIDLVQITEALPQLDSETLAELAQQSRQYEGDVAGSGFIGLLIILLLLVVVASWVLGKKVL
jgi:hypothetical protein